MLINRAFFVLPVALFMAACGATGGQRVVPVTLAPTEIAVRAPIYTATPTFTITPSPTITFTFTPSLTPTITPTATDTLTPTGTPSPTERPTATPTNTPLPTATLPLLTLTPVAPGEMPPAIALRAPGLSPAEGWSCGDFPCEDDIAGFLERIRVPDGFELSHVGRFPGQPMQIVYGPDQRLYATILEDGSRMGAVYAMGPDGATERYSGDFVSPVGLAFQPGGDTLYVSGRVGLEGPGGLWRALSDGKTELVTGALPCCFSSVDNQPAGMVFGPDGMLYLGVGSLTDHAEPQDPAIQRNAEIHPLEAAILRMNPHTGTINPYGRGIRYPYDLAFASSGQFYAVDNGLVTGPGDRLLAIKAGAHYGWPYWRARGCEGCPGRRASLEIAGDLVTLPDFTLPRGLTVYQGDQFPENMFDTLFVALWNGAENAQRVVWIDLHSEEIRSEDYMPKPFITGLIRPVDVTVAPDGSLVVADFIYGHIWRVRYVGLEDG